MAEQNGTAVLLTEIRDLLKVIAEPELAKREKAAREALLKVCGRSKHHRHAVRFMDGTRSQSEIVKDSGIDSGTISRLVKALAKEKLIPEGGIKPKLVCSLPVELLTG